ncbi:MAG: PQQ-binding-like beta-propeller repeat protein, partial [Pseudomonadales bacterium]
MVNLRFLCIAALASFCIACNSIEQPTSAEVAAPAAANGEELFATNCATCHNGRVSKAPPITLLQIMSSASILNSLEHGIMEAQSAHLSRTQKKAVVSYLTGDAGERQHPAPKQCEGDALAFDYSAQPDAQTWGVDLGNSRFYDDGVTDINANNISQLKLKWAFAFPDAIRARSQPTTAAGALFLGSQDGTVYSLDQKTGCVRWTFKTIAEVRTGIIVAPWGEDNSSLSYFGDLIGNVYAVNTFTGELVWRDRPDDHPSLTLTATPVLHDGRLIVPLSALEVTEAADPT